MTRLRAVRIVAAAGCALSVAAAVEYVLLPGAFCDAGSGCDRVRASAGVWGAMLPAIGLGGFTTLFAATFWPGQTGARLLRAVSLVGAAAGAALLLIQLLVIGSTCWLCVGADAAGLLAGALVLAWPARPEGNGLPWLLHASWYLAIALLPAAWGLARPADVPAEVRALWRDGVINVVELSDFECPFCRALHPHLASELEGRRDIHFVRKSYPLPGHRHARDATAAYLCASELGRGEAMAHAMFTADDLSPAGLLQLAAELELELGALERCMQADSTQARIDDDMSTIRATRFRGLPTVWIGAERIEGFDRAAGAAPYRRALARAARSEAPGHGRGPWLLLLLIVGLPAAAGTWQAMGRRRSNDGS